MGVLAGSVFGITAGGSAAQAWSALSGATNGIQSDLGDTSLSKATRAANISNIVSNYRRDILGLMDGGLTQDEFDKFVTLSIFTSTDCAVATKEQAVDPFIAAKKVLRETEEIADDVKLSDPAVDDAKPK